MIHCTTRSEHGSCGYAMRGRSAKWGKDESEFETEASQPTSKSSLLLYYSYKKGESYEKI